MSLLTRPVPVFALAALLRLALLLYGHVQDTTMPMKYTDIDYFVFLDAAAFVAAHGSPYRRETYRYTPLLAWLLVPTAWHRRAGFPLLRRGMDEGRALKFACIWLLNPFVATISTRGSSEGLLGVLVMALLWAVLERRVALAGVLLGLGVHFKIYPFIYAPAIVWWMDDQRMGKKKPGDAGAAVSVMGRMTAFVTPERRRLVVVSFTTFMALNILMFSL
jgi:GPI mannosyltransferase 1 subunit M